MFQLSVMPLNALLFAVAAPGKFSDQADIECTALPMALDALPLGAYILGDAEKTMTVK